VVARERFAADADKLTQFYGTFSFYTGIAALLIQVLLTGTVLQRFGLAVTILALPVALGAGSLLILLVPGFWSVLVTNAADQGLRFSVDKSTYELLFLPLPPENKWNVKVTIDTVINRLADGVGGLALGLATQGFLALPGANLNLRGLAALTAIMCGAWIAVAMALQRGYVQVIRDSIRQHRLDAERASAAMRDKTAADEVMSRLGTGDPKEILYALELFETQHRRATHPALHSLISHPSVEVRRKALTMLRERGDPTVKNDVERLLTDEDPEIRTEALLYLAYHAQVDPVERIQELGDFPNFSIRAGMVAFLGQPGRFQNLDAVQVMLQQMASEQGQEGRQVRLEAARLLAMLPDEFDTILRGLLEDEDAEVVQAAMHAVTQLGREDLADEILARIGDPQLATDATTALAGMGDAVVSTLAERLADASVPVDIRREIPAILVGIGTPEAQRALFENLLESDPALRYRVIAALNKLRAIDPSMAIDTMIVETVMVAEIMGHYRSYQLLGTLGETLDGEGPVVTGLRDSMQQETERIFRLIGLLVPDRDIYTAYLGIGSGDKTVRANALEFLDTILNPSLRGLLLPLVDPTITISERVKIANRVVGAPVETREEAVLTLLRSEDPWIRSCGAYAVGTLHLRSLEPELDKWLDAEDALLRETARAAKRRLAEEALVEAKHIVEKPAAEWKPPESMGVG
jgi:AAA family ATP:ADP antiporter